MSSFRSSMWSLVLVVASVFALALQHPSATVRAETILSGTLVQVIDTSAWVVPSPDPSGISYWLARDRLVVVDGEVEEIMGGVTQWVDANLFVLTRQGMLTGRHDITPFTTEPVGIDIDVAPNGRFYISDDSHRRIFEIDLGHDGNFNTADDVVTSFTTLPFNDDPEGLTLASINGRMVLFTVDGRNRRIWRTDPGANGRFEENGDDVWTGYDIAIYGLRDPEGVEFDPSRGTLWVVDRGVNKLYEFSTSGTLLGTLDLRTFIPTALIQAT